MRGLIIFTPAGLDRFRPRSRGFLTRGKQVNWAQLVLLVFLVDDGWLVFRFLFKLLLRAHHDIFVILHLAAARKHRHTKVTVSLNAINSECLFHFYERLFVSKINIFIFNSLKTFS